MSTFEKKKMDKFDYKKLKGLREAKGITQNAMSELLNMTQSNYSKLENGAKKIDSMQTLENLGTALEISVDRLVGILAGQENIDPSGMKAVDLWKVHQVIKSEPLREDEFVFFAKEILDFEQFNFKGFYPGPNLSKPDADPDDPMAIMSVLNEIKLINATGVEIGFEHSEDQLKNIGVWLGGAQLGRVASFDAAMINELINRLLISRVVIIAADDCIAGFYDTYLKVVFIATNAVNKSSEFSKGRFSRIDFMSHDEVITQEQFEELD